MYEDSDNQSSKSKMAINATVLPNAVKKHAEELLKNKLLKGVDADGADIKKGSSITADVWDFAGQHLYYAAHPVFLSSRAVYIVVHNLNKPLNARAQPCVRQGTQEVTLENPTNETNLENLLSWLGTVHNMRPTEEEMVETPTCCPISDLQCSSSAPMLTSHTKILRMLHPRYFVRFPVRNMENM